MAKADKSKKAKFSSKRITKSSPETEELFDEHHFLLERLERLEKRIGTPTAPTPEFLAMDEADRFLVLNQLAAMSTYEYNLNVRLERSVARDGREER